MSVDFQIRVMTQWVKVNRTIRQFNKKYEIIATLKPAKIVGNCGLGGTKRSRINSRCVLGRGLCKRGVATVLTAD